MLNVEEISRELDEMDAAIQSRPSPAVGWFEQASGPAAGNNAGAAWRKDPRYFTSVRISSLALMRMSQHAESGGSHEVMGVVTGIVRDGAFVVFDSFALPVEATETRVNAMAEGYEFMVQYLQSLQSLGRREHVVGWYHSHPGYGCWLSGIDVRTQMQNQAFQDPFVAIVIDPVQTATASKVVISAFRTLPDALSAKQRTGSAGAGAAGNGALARSGLGPIASSGASTGSAGPGPGPGSKLAEFGAYADAYYSLTVSYFSLPCDTMFKPLMRSDAWTAALTAGSGPVSRSIRSDCAAAAAQLALDMERAAKSLANGKPRSSHNLLSSAFSSSSPSSATTASAVSGAAASSAASASASASASAAAAATAYPNLNPISAGSSSESETGLFLRAGQNKVNGRAGSELLDQGLVSSLQNYRVATARARSAAANRQLRRELFGQP